VYLAITVCIGIYASRRVRDAKDFMVAGRSLPLYMNFACVFATWFGAETVLSISATFTRDGFVGVSGDPFGAAFCLVLVALFFAKVFYRMDLLTIGDFYRKRFGQKVEVFTAVVITVSYLGWASAQMTALGLVLHILAEGAWGSGALPLNTAIVIGAVIVGIYVIFGGMWSLALTDLFQTSVMVVGLIIIAIILGNQAGGMTEVVRHAYEADKLRLVPAGGTREWLGFIGAFLTVALGSIPQQDVFQRVTSAKNEQTAVAGTLAGGIFYLAFAFVPMFIAYSAIVIDPSVTTLFGAEDQRTIQKIIPDLILQQTPVWAQTLFFGALLSAILSTASGTLLAPATLFTENVLRPFLPQLSDQTLLMTMRMVLVLFAVATTAYAISSNETMYQMVQGAYSVTLVGAVVPLVMGVYWKRSTPQGAFVSIALGVIVWLTAKALVGQDPMVPPQLFGLAASFVGMVVGSSVPQIARHGKIGGFEPSQSNTTYPAAGRVASSKLN
jgi:SSS family transporter